MVTPQMDREVFERQMRAELESVMQGAADAVDHAPAGPVIRDSEETIHQSVDGGALGKRRGASNR